MGLRLYLAYRIWRFKYVDCGGHLCRWSFEWFLPFNYRLGKRGMYLEAQGICRVETAFVALVTEITACVDQRHDTKLDPIPQCGFSNSFQKRLSIMFNFCTKAVAVLLPFVSVARAQTAPGFPVSTTESLNVTYGSNNVSPAGELIPRPGKGLEISQPFGCI